MVNYIVTKLCTESSVEVPEYLPYQYNVSK